MAIHTRLTKFFGITHPIVLAPMTPAAGAALAISVADAGGLALLGGGYGDRAWFEQEQAKLGNRADIGCGFISWSIARDMELFDRAMTRLPRAMMLSFGDPQELATRVKAAGIPLICQIQTLDHARRALDCGADVLVAQGTEAGGHGFQSRSTMTFVPEVVDLVARGNSDAMVLAAGGIADGRGLAAALMLGADGVLMGTRFWATKESIIHSAAKERVLKASGDATIRTRVYDVVRRKAWPKAYTGRLMVNDFIERWHGQEDALAALADDELTRVESAYSLGDYDVAQVIVGEAIGLINDLPSAGDLVQRVVAQAEKTIQFGYSSQETSTH